MHDDCLNFSGGTIFYDFVLQNVAFKYILADSVFFAKIWRKLIDSCKIKVMPYFQNAEHQWFL